MNFSKRALTSLKLLHTVNVNSPSPPPPPAGEFSFSRKSWGPQLGIYICTGPLHQGFFHHFFILYNSFLISAKHAKINFYFAKICNTKGNYAFSQRRVLICVEFSESTCNWSVTLCSLIICTANKVWLRVVL